MTKQQQLAQPVTRGELRKAMRLVLAIVIVAIAVGGAVTAMTTSAATRREADRNEAMKYQRCVQTSESAISSNADRRVTAKVVQRTSRFTAALVVVIEYIPARAVPPAVLHELRAAAEAFGQRGVDARATSGPAIVPDCAGTYPRGKRVTHEIGMITPTLADPGPRPTTTDR